MRAAAFALACLTLAGCGEDPVPKLEAELAALLERTAPKAEFWAEVERKGTLATEQRAVEKELAAERARADALDPEIAQIEASLAGARESVRGAENAVATARSEASRLASEVEKRERRLAIFAARRRAPEPAP